MNTDPPDNQLALFPALPAASVTLAADPAVATNEEPPSPPELDGTWERKQRSPITAAVVGMLLVGLVYFTGQVVLLVPAIIAQVLSAPDSTAELETAEILALIRTPLLVALTISQYLFMALPAWLLARRWHVGKLGSVARYVRLRAADWRVMLLTPLLTIAFIPPANYLSELFMEWLGLRPDSAKELEALFTAHSFPELVLLGFVIAITPAICEELFFRGYVQRTFERGIGSRSIWVTGVLFGLFHFQPVSLPTLALMGILLGYLYHRTQSLLPSMVAHFTNNFMVVLLLYLAQANPAIAAESEHFSIEVVLISAAICVLLLLAVHRLTRGNGEQDQSVSVLPSS
ncbi:MAG: CPBP family intramembrane metalloprotease [Armatimonadetes bacterium]|nr:CPBP family intramembrane metalloprotease [Armatimonadota bacterium]